jgi:hypothetical protein
MTVMASVVEPALTDCPVANPTDTTVPLIGVVSWASARLSCALISEALAASIEAWSLAICSALSDAVDPPWGDEEPVPDDFVPELADGVELAAGVELPEGLVEPVPAFAWLVVAPVLEELAVVPGVVPPVVVPPPGEPEPPDGLEPDVVDAPDPPNNLASVASVWATTF